MERSVRFKFRESNYEVVIYTPRVAKDPGVTIVELFNDSKLMANQFSVSYHTKNDIMSAYLDFI